MAVPDAHGSLFSRELLGFIDIWFSHYQIHYLDSAMLLHILTKLGDHHTVYPQGHVYLFGAVPLNAYKQAQSSGSPHPFFPCLCLRLLFTECG